VIRVSWRTLLRAIDGIHRGAYVGAAGVRSR
jgi:hypothetical protein